MKNTSKLSRLILGATLLTSTQAMALTSCWQDPDPVGCAIQCMVMGYGNQPCPVSATVQSDVSKKISFDVNLPVKSEKYMKVKELLSNQIKKAGSERKRPLTKSSLKQVCSPNDLLSVVEESRLQNPKLILDKCFMKVETKKMQINTKNQLLKKN